MSKALTTVTIGLVSFILTQTLVGVLITGTDTGSTILQQILALAVAIGTVVATLLSFLHINKNNG